MNAIQSFVFPDTGQSVRTVLVDGEPWFVGRDACDVIGISKHRDALAQLDTDERASTAVDTLGGPQTMTTVSEAGLYALMLISRSPKVRTFRRWVTHDVLPAVRRTGRYEAVPLSRRELAEYWADAERRAEAAETKVAELEPAARVGEAVRAADGITIRTFHKKYFSDVPERKFFDHLYRHGYLINQRGKGRLSERTGQHRDGPQHRHPTAAGKAYLYLHTGIDRNDGRRENARVRPGEPEVAFRDVLIRQGLPCSSGRRQLAIGGAA